VALRQPRVDRLVLLAPALDFSGNRLRDLGDRGLEEWRRTDTLNVFHYGFGRMMPVRFGLYEDAARYDAMQARLDIPIQIFQGSRDVAVSTDFRALFHEIATRHLAVPATAALFPGWTPTRTALGLLG